MVLKSRRKVTKKLRIDKWELAIFCAHTTLFRLKKLKNDVGVALLPLRHIKHSHHFQL